MAWFKKKPDPISDRARALNEEIAALEAKIQRLDTQLQQAPPPAANWRSTAIPHGETIQRTADGPAAKPSTPDPRPSPAPPQDPVFEEVDQDRLQSQGEVAAPEHYNDLGVRKYDLPALLRWVRKSFSAGHRRIIPSSVHYLAAGGVQGLRPLRYEKRVARNRFIFFVAFLFFAILVIILVAVRHHCTWEHRYAFAQKLRRV